jgi:hypothetical protein
MGIVDRDGSQAFRDTFHAHQNVIDNSDFISEINNYNATSKGHGDCLDGAAGTYFPA